MKTKRRDGGARGAARRGRANAKKLINETVREKQAPSWSPIGARGVGAEFAERALVIVCFTLSGFAALLYQTAWLREFTIIFGTSHLAVVAVLAAYMGGLSLGAGVASRFVHRIKRPVLVYGLLEAGIAISALLIPVGVKLAQGALTLVLGQSQALPAAGGAIQTVFYLVAAFMVLAAPTAFMGATLPILARHAIRSDREVGPWIGLLYGANTGGAVLGVLVTAFYLVPHLGLFGALIVGVLINLAIFGFAALLSVGAKCAGREEVRAVSADRLDGFFDACVRPLFSHQTARSQKKQEFIAARRYWILPLIGFSGAISFLYEVLWTRLLTHSMNGTIYAFATMLASFLIGIALGGAIAGAFARTRERAAMMFFGAQLFIAAFSVAAYAMLESLTPNTRAIGANALYAMSIMLPGALFIGATFPLSVRILADNETQAAAISGRVYMWNTVGAIVGAILAGFYIIPGLGFTGAIKFAVAANLVLAGAALALTARPRLYQVIAVAGVIASVVLFFFPSRPDALIFANVKNDRGSGRELFYAVGRSSTVLLRDVNGYFELSTDGLPESSITRLGAAPARHSQMWLSALPAIARPQAKSMLIIGLGGGMTVAAAPSNLDKIDVVELEDQVVRANETIAALRAEDPLSDPRVSIVENDARNALLRSSSAYDIIVSQPSHPWTAGASHLYTREFLLLAKRRLAKDGVFLQWINSRYVDEPLLRILSSTIAAVFDNVRLYEPVPGVLLFLGSDAPIEPERAVEETRSYLDSAQAEFRPLGVNGVEDLLVALALDDRGVRALSEGSPFSTDNMNYMAVRSLPAGDGLSASDTRKLFAQWDPLLDPQSWVYGDLAGRIDFTYIADQQIRGDQEQRAFEMARRAATPAMAHFIDALGYRSFGQQEKSVEAFKAALALSPEDEAIRFEFMQPNLPNLARASDEIWDAVLSRFSGEPRHVLEALRASVAGEWGVVEGYDAILAAAPITRPWGALAARMRAEWRVAASVRRNDPAIGREALSIIDSFIASYWNFDLYILRAGCGIVIGDDAVFEESVWSATEVLKARIERAKDGKYEFSSGELRAFIDRLASIRQELANAPAREAQAYRHEEVRSRVDDVLASLRQLEAF